MLRIMFVNISASRLYLERRRIDMVASISALVSYLVMFFFFDLESQIVFRPVPMMIVNTSSSSLPRWASPVSRWRACSILRPGTTAWAHPRVAKPASADAEHEKNKCSISSVSHLQRWQIPLFCSLTPSLLTLSCVGKSWWSSLKRKEERSLVRPGVLISFQA